MDITRGIESLPLLQQWKQEFLSIRSETEKIG